LQNSKAMDVCSLQEYHRHFERVRLPKVEKEVAS